MPPSAGAQLPLGLEDVRAAAMRIEGRVVRTPVLLAPRLDEQTGVRLWLKAENLQRIGAFKARGAMHAIGRLDPTTREAGVLTFSSGNHAQAVALAAKSFAVRATIAMPTDAPAIKVAVVRELGATVIFAGTTSDERRTAALELQSSQGGTIIEPFDHPDIIAGAATATLEFVEEVAARTDGEGLDALLVPVGGGGLIAGACIVGAAHNIPVFGAEPEGCDALARSLAAGEPVAVMPGATLADGLKPVQVGALNFDIARQVVAGSFTVTDAELGRTLVALLMRAKLLVEPSGAAALAVAIREGRGLLSNFVDQRRPNVGVVLSGGNVDPGLVAKLLAEHGGT